MGKDKSIVFKSIPGNFKSHEKVYVMQYEFAGIQSFIFGDVTLYSTRREIASRSEFVQAATDSMEQWLAERFGRWDRFRVLSKSSGKLICAVSNWAKPGKITALSDELQRIIYSSTSGRLEMFYSYCAARVISADEADGYENCMSYLAIAANRNKFHCVNTLGAVEPGNKRTEFIPKDSEARTDDSSQSSDIKVAVKFDLDNLGAFFKTITSFDERKAASECLASVLEGAFAGVSGVEPLFIGGDDIFAIAEIDSYIHTVSEMYHNIVKGINSHEELADYRDSFGISGGISFIRNDLGVVPMVYYYEQSEDSLMRAKGIAGKNVISTPNCILTWSQLDTLSDIMSRKGDRILKGLDSQQCMNMYFNIRELRGRILRMHKIGKRKLLTMEEEQNVYSIN